MKKLHTILILAMSVLFLLALPAETVSAAPAEGTVIALGADLDPGQRATVLSLMGVTEDELANYKVITITNEQEHKYLDSYIDSSVIGSRALSSVMVSPAEAGHGVMVTTQNINYCTTGMYRNALLTAGVEDADILVVGPSSISGTSALIGAIKAYEETSGESIPDQTLDTALNEMVTTGAIAEKSANSEEVEALVAYIKAKLAAGELDNEEEIRDAVAEGEQKFGVTLTDDEVQQIVDFMLKIKKLGLDPNVLLDQATDLYDQFGDELLTKAQNGELTGTGGLGDFFAQAKAAVAGFFQKILAK